MKKFVLLLLILIAIGEARTQDKTSDASPLVEVIKHGWEKVRIDWMKDPLISPTGENFYEMRTRVSTERRQRSALEERSISAAKEEKRKPPPPPRYAFMYKLTVQNAASKSIKELDWDYIFTDASTGEILGMREFTSNEKIGPGKRKDLTITVSSPPTSRISVHSLGKNEHEGVLEKVVVRRVMYDDGTIRTAK